MSHARRLNVGTTPLPGVLTFEPAVHGDERGFFVEAYNARDFEAAVGFAHAFVQDNHSRSRRGVLRGLHYQLRQAQGKLIRVLDGEIYDVAVDLRRGSPAFGRWYGLRMRAEDHRQLWIPAGCAHGFLVLSERADVLYKTTDYYAPEHERCIRFDDATLGIDWPIDGAPIVSERDRAGADFVRAEVYEP